jgi:hypothetical protein
MILKLQIGNLPRSHRKENTLKPKNPINAILDTLASQQRQGETSLFVRLEPDLIQDAMNALRGYRKLFAPVIPGLTDTVPIYAAYERMRQADVTQHTILLFVECQTMGSSVRLSAGCRFESLLSGALLTMVTGNSCSEVCFKPT